MNKRKAITFGSVILGAVILSVVAMMYFRYADAPIIAEPLVEDEFLIPETNIPQKEENSTPYSVPPIKAEVKDIIQEPAASTHEDNVPPPEVIETTSPDGTVVQTPNWEAQKELAPGTDLNDPDKQPEYVKPSTSEPAKPSQPSGNSGSSKESSGNSGNQSNSGSSGNSSNSSNSSNSGGSSTPASGNNGNSTNTGSTPKNGDTKVIDGHAYTYIKPFGWVKDGDGGTTEYIDVELSGEKVGH